MKSTATQADVHEFMSALYPGCAELALASLDEGEVLRLAAKKLRALSRAYALIAEVRNAHRDTESEDYNWCDEHRCQWCTWAEEVLATK